MRGIITASLWPEPKPRKHLEDELQRAVATYLRWALPDDATFTHLPLGGQRHTKAAARLVGFGTKAGWPDLIIVFRGRALFIELKTLAGVLSDVQKQAHKKLSYCGADVMLCRSVPDVETQLRKAGVPLKARVC